MSKEIAKTEEKSIANIVTNFWQDTEKLRKLVFPKLNEIEFEFLVALGAGLGANPFTREIWAVKYKDSEPASIFVGRDFLRRKAQEIENYGGHEVDSFYQNDKIIKNNGIYEINFAANNNRGELVGAICNVFYRNNIRPFSVMVYLKEYAKPFGNWKSMPETMIKKVAEAQALRGAFQGVFKGIYDESENWVDVEHTEVKNEPKKIEMQKENKPKPKKICTEEIFNLMLKTFDVSKFAGLGEKYETTPEQLAKITQHIAIVSKLQEPTNNKDWFDSIDIPEWESVELKEYAAEMYDKLLQRLELIKNEK